tara:strand:+ start:588 stop:842 length:255 start_codon:yes stop_codon:yes gene_type:complete
MRLFIYKTLVVILSLFFLYQFTVGYSIHKIQNKLYSVYDEDTAKKIKSKLRDEIKKGINKDRILSKEDALLLKQFFQKINDEIN